MSSADRLYTNEVLALATSLARWPLDGDLPLAGAARSAACGSSLTLGIATDHSGLIERLGLRASACAIGQASAAIFANHAIGRSEAEIAAAAESVENWLNGGNLPDWPGFSAIAAARDFPARHGAIRLPFRAALVAFGHPG